MLAEMDLPVSLEAETQEGGRASQIPSHKSIHQIKNDIMWIPFPFLNDYEYEEDSRGNIFRSIIQPWKYFSISDSLWWICFVTFHCAVFPCQLFIRMDLWFLYSRAWLAKLCLLSRSVARMSNWGAVRGLGREDLFKCEDITETVTTWLAKG